MAIPNVFAGYLSEKPGARTKATLPYNYDPFTIWKGDGEPNGSVYTDRLYQWDAKKHNALCRKHFGNEGQYWAERDTDQIQAFLRDYFGAPELVLCEVQEHCNQATGYPCWYFAYQKTPANGRENENGIEQTVGAC